MQRDKQIEQILDSIRKVAFYVGHGKYNDYMTTDEVLKIKATLEKILEIEKEYKEANTDNEKELIYEKIAVFKTFTVKDFINFDI